MPVFDLRVSSWHLIPKFHSFAFPGEAQNGADIICAPQWHTAKTSGSKTLWWSSQMAETLQSKPHLLSFAATRCSKPTNQPGLIKMQEQTAVRELTSCFLSCLAPFWTGDQGFHSQMIHQTPTSETLLASTQNLHSGQEFCETPPGIGSRGKCAQ